MVNRVQASENYEFTSEVICFNCKTEFRQVLVRFDERVCAEEERFYSIIQHQRAIVTR